MTAYRDLSKAYHPDRLASMQLPAEMLEYAEAMQRRINAAFEELRGAAKFRGPRPAPEQPAQPQPTAAQPSAQPQPRHAVRPQPSAAQPRPDMNFKKDFGPRWATEAA